MNADLFRAQQKIEALERNPMAAVVEQLRKENSELREQRDRYKDHREHFKDERDVYLKKAQEWEKWVFEHRKV